MTWTQPKTTAETMSLDVEPVSHTDLGGVHRVSEQFRQTQAAGETPRPLSPLNAPRPREAAAGVASALSKTWRDAQPHLSGRKDCRCAVIRPLSQGLAGVSGWLDLPALVQAACPCNQNQGCRPSWKWERWARNPKATSRCVNRRLPLPGLGLCICSLTR